MTGRKPGASGDPQRHHRRSIRVKGYDYTLPGAYFVTICAYEHRRLFGQVTDDEAVLNGYGRAVERQWRATAEARPGVELDEYVVMPNHFPGVLWITDDGEGTARRAPTRARFGKPVSGSLPTVVRSFKAAVTRQINQLRETPGVAVWQRGYYEHIVRNRRSLERIRDYIASNPAMWHLDVENPRAGVRDRDAYCRAIRGA